MKITATIITLNEERNIERCIRSLEGVADEIIVLDSFSTDRTKEICEGLASMPTVPVNVRFEQRPWQGYSESKNALNELVSTDYILSLDADEALDDELKKEIIALKSNPNPQVYTVNRLTNYCGKWIKHSGWYPDVKVRLFPKEGSYWDGAIVHETLIFPKDLKVEALAGHLEHYSYYSKEDHRNRADNYSRLTAMKMHKMGKKASLLKPYLSAIGRFVSMYLFKLGFLDGKMGFRIARISAQSNVFKYKELRRLNRENN